MKTINLLTISSFVYSLLTQSLVSEASHRRDDVEVSNRITLGIDALPSEYPYLVRLEASYGRLCGAAVIAEYYVLTAAHCVWDVERDSIALFPSTWVKGDKTEVHIVQRYIPDVYDATSLAYDISILKTRENLVKDIGMEIIGLPNPGTYYPPGAEVFIAGWGKTETHYYPNALMHGLVTVKEWSFCDWEFRHTRPECPTPDNCPVRHVPRRTICTHRKDYKSGVCFGDSGGPIVINGTIAGIIFGTIVNDGYCENESPSLHTKVADYLPWIYAIIDPGVDTTQFCTVAEPEQDGLL